MKKKNIIILSVIPIFLNITKKRENKKKRFNWWEIERDTVLFGSFLAILAASLAIISMTNDVKKKIKNIETHSNNTLSKLDRLINHHGA